MSTIAPLSNSTYAGIPLVPNSPLAKALLVTVSEEVCRGPTVPADRIGQTIRWENKVRLLAWSKVSLPIQVGEALSIAPEIMCKRINRAAAGVMGVVSLTVTQSN